MKTLFTPLILTLAFPAAASAAAWNIDASHSAAEFSVTHMMVAKTTGEFTGIKGTIDLDERNLAKSRVDVTIDINSIDTRDAKRDGHLKSADFFDASKFPTMKFKSKKITKKGKGYSVLGDLTIKGKTLPVTLTATVSESVKHPFSGQMVRGVEATTTIDRTKWGVKWNKALDKGGIMVGNDIEITIHMELAQPGSKKS